MVDQIEGSKLLTRIIQDDEEGYTTIAEYPTGKSRWHTNITTIFKRENDSKLFMTNWRQAATEYQEHEFPDAAHECESFQVTETRYRRKSS